MPLSTDFPPASAAVPPADSTAAAKPPAAFPPTDPPTARRPYRTPVLEIFGALGVITQTSMGTMMPDGGSMSGADRISF